MSWLTSGTITASSFCATQPAIPCPILMRTSLSACASLADGQLEVELLLGFVEQQQRPVVRTQKFVDLLHDGAENLIELQRRRQRLPQLLEDRDFAGFALFIRNSRVAAAFDGRKLLYFLHACLNLVLERAAEGRLNLQINVRQTRSLTQVANPRHINVREKSGATCT